jgi:hypothetical protein
MKLKQHISNYYCYFCKESGKIPNILGRFYLIDENNCICNGCNTIYDKKFYYKKQTINAINVEKYNE